MTKPVKSLSVYQPIPGLAPWDLEAEMPHQALSLQAITAESESEQGGKNDDTARGKYHYLSFSLLMKLSPED